MISSDEDPPSFVNINLLEEFTAKEKEKLILMGTTPPKKLLLQFSRHAISGMVTNAIYLIVDSLVLSQKYPMQQSAAAFSLPISVYGPTSLSLLIGMGVNHGLSQALGKKNFVDAKKFLSTAIQLAFVLWGIYCAIFIPLMKRVIILLGCPTELVPYGMQYSKIMIYGSIFAILSQTLSNALRALGQARASGESLALGILVAIIVEPCLIYCTDLGVKGAAAAYVIGHGVAVLISFFFFVTKGKFSAVVTLDFKSLFMVYPAKIMHIFLYGLGSFFSNFSTGLAAGITNHLITSHSAIYYEAAALGATLGSASSLVFLFFSACIGIDTAIISCGSFAISAGLQQRARVIFIRGLIYNTVIMIVGCGLLLCLSTVTPYIFYGHNSDADKHFRSIMTKINLIILPGRLICGPLLASFAILSANSYPLISALMSSTRKLIFFIPIIYIVAAEYNYPLPLICSYPTADICAAVVSVAVLFFMRKTLHIDATAKKGKLNLDINNDEHND